MRPVHWFLIAAIAWTWAWVWPVALSSRGILDVELPQLLVASCALLGLPLLALVFAIAGRRGHRMVRPWFAMMTPRISPRAWMVAVIPPVAILASAFAWAAVVRPEGFAFRGSFSSAAPGVLLFATLEELAWRGYALPRLVHAHRSPAHASWVLSGAWALWHLPIFMIEGQGGGSGYLSWVPFFVAFCFFLNWMTANARYSILPAILSHFLVNEAAIQFSPDWMEHVGSLGGALLLLPIVVAAYHRRRWPPPPARSVAPA